MKIWTLFGVAALGFAGTGFGQYATDPVGFVSVRCLSGSDTHVSVPFNQAVAFAGKALTASGNVITVEGSPAWVTDAFVTPRAHFVKVISGTKAGAWFTIVSNGANSLTLNLDQGSLTNVAGADIRVYPFLKLGDVFPVGNATIHQSASTSVIARRSTVLIPNSSGSGTNLLPEGSYYLTPQGWRTSIALPGPIAVNSLVDPYLRPDSYFIVRHRSQEPTTTFTAVGSVEMHPVQTVITTLPAASSDHPVSNLRPVPVKLRDLGLVSSGAFLGSNGTSVIARRDVLYVYDNTVAGTNKLPKSTFYYDSQASSWRDAQASNRVANDDEILPGSGFVIRKFRVADGLPRVWTHSLVLQ